MYALNYLPAALRDMEEIVRYVSKSLQNPAAADQLATALVEAAEGLRDFPYAYPVYQPIRPLTHEYRKLGVQNYLLFYWVDEVQKTVTVARVIYARRSISRQLR